MEVAHKQAMAQLSASLENIFIKFRRLDKRISKVSHTAVRIGNTLETVNSLKEVCM